MSYTTIPQTASLPFHKIQMPQDYVAYEVTVSGGHGGSYEKEIANNRANAIKVLANLLLVAIRQLDIKLYLVSFEGGKDATEIPASAKAKVVVPKDKTEVFDTLVTQCDQALEGQFAETDPTVMVDSLPSVWHSAIVSEEGTHLLLACLNGIPVGVTDMLDDGIPSDTSNNIGIVTMQAAKDKSTAMNTFTITSIIRSQDSAKATHLANQIRKIWEVSGATVSSKE